MRDGNYSVMLGTFVELDGKDCSIPMAASRTMAPIQTSTTRGPFYCVPINRAIAPLPQIAAEVSMTRIN